MPTFVICLIVAVALFTVTSVVWTQLLTVTKYRIEDKVPDVLDGCRCLVLSDLHCTSFGRGNRRLFARIRECDPDMVIIAGDVINGHRRSEIKYARALFEMLASLRIPVYYAYGNHEEKMKRKPELYADYLELAFFNTTLLNEQTVRVSDLGMALSGIVLPPDFDRGPVKEQSEALDLSHCFKDTLSIDYKILIAHDPTFIRRYLETGADLIVSGHIHGGIIRLPFIGGLLSPRRRFLPRPDKGLFRYRNTNLLISGGIGWHGLPIRFLNTPELVMIYFKHKGRYHEPGSKAGSLRGTARSAASSD